MRANQFKEGRLGESAKKGKRFLTKSAIRMQGISEDEQERSGQDTRMDKDEKRGWAVGKSQKGGRDGESGN